MSNAGVVVGMVTTSAQGYDMVYGPIPTIDAPVVTPLDGFVNKVVANPTCPIVTISQSDWINVFTGEILDS